MARAAAVERFSVIAGNSGSVGLRGIARGYVMIRRRVVRDCAGLHGSAVMRTRVREHCSARAVEEEEYARNQRAQTDRHGSAHREDNHPQNACRKRTQNDSVLAPAQPAGSLRWSYSEALDGTRGNWLATTVSAASVP